MKKLNCPSCKPNTWVKLDRECKGWIYDFKIDKQNVKVIENYLDEAMIFLQECIMLIRK